MPRNPGIIQDVAVEESIRILYWYLCLTNTIAFGKRSTVAHGPQANSTIGLLGGRSLAANFDLPPLPLSKGVK